MRYVLLFLVFAAALVIVGCSGTTLFFTAFNAAREPWQQWLQGSGMAAIVAWEAGALLAIALCFKARYWATGIGAIVLLVLAMAVTSRQELRLYVGGQADILASRSVQADDRNRVRAELERAYKRRDDLQAIVKLTIYQKDDLAEVMHRIGDLEKRWDTRTENVRASGSAEGELAHRLLGTDIDLSQALLDTLPLWFWMFARVFSIPAAAVAMHALWGDRKRKEPAEAPRGMQVAPTVSSPVAHRVARSELSRKTIAETPPQPPRPDDTPPPGDVKLSTSNIEDSHDGDKQSISKIATARDSAGPRIVINNDTDGHEKQRHIISLERGKKKTNGLGNVKEWLSECTSQTPDGRVKTTSKECHQSYRAWCEIGGWHPVGQQDLARKMSAILGRPTKTKGNAKNGRAPRDGAGRVWPGLLVYAPSAVPLRATA